ncbi:sarcosine oxidase subunit gamma [Pseudonocardia bannensis]|uniref:Sarcosine oxidase subunit gamma n=1 Tax=Pseudonocardia bannensis TaxID=630973 RepID=A0A848DCN9_9PSEU|nr:sarcosine oxidase subunit gamma family protein [Pseudonocardia bannensis]NMH90360.1 sarcosine oxidase subunit gamma [Pseudonocardia bannensis]
MAETSTRRSPLAGHADRLAAATLRSAGALRIEEQPFRTHLDLRLDPSGPGAGAFAGVVGVALPVEPGTTAAGTGVEALWLGPDEWLLVGPPGTDGELAARVHAAVGDEPVSVVDVSAQHATLLLAGPRARDVLAHGCSIDLHPRVFGAGHCAQTMLARAPVVLVADGPDAIRVIVRSSFARYLADWLLDAATEHIAAGA